ncbi:ABC transporter ATP-binding protein [Sphingobium baderi LL03]|uniref:ABC transporter ATP-binding protein n=2 Tax=Sphingobium baderi TaxID=1332080 RepID=T0HLU9_9SPHN|nr:ABC transporter ATP-binding protein [Sphingobium baderi LL03]
MGHMIGDTLTPQTAYAVEAHGLVKTFGDFRAVNGIDIAVPTGTIYGVLGPNGAGKTTLLRTLLGIVDPDEGHRTLLGDPQPLRQSRLVGYLPEERGLYPSMKAYDAIAFMGALRGLPLKIGRERARAMLEAHGLGASADKPIRQLSKGMAQTVQLFGTIVHEPRLIVLDEPFSGLDAINQGKLEALIREQARAGVTVLFSTHVIAHAERLCERIAIVAGGRIRFEGSVTKARDRLRPQVTLRTRSSDGPWRRALPGETLAQDGAWHFALPDGGIEPLLRALLDADAGIESLSIERPGLHDAFVAIAGEAVARQMEEDRAREDTA